MELGTVSYFLIGAVAKAVATVLTYPLQLVQTRLRVSKTHDAENSKAEDGYQVTFEANV